MISTPSSNVLYIYQSPLLFVICLSVFVIIQGITVQRLSPSFAVDVDYFYSNERKVRRVLI